jgi:hypothetical protein
MRLRSAGGFFVRVAAMPRALHGPAFAGIEFAVAVAVEAIEAGAVAIPVAIPVAILVAVAVAVAVSTPFMVTAFFSAAAISTAAISAAAPLPGFGQGQCAEECHGQCNSRE